MGLPLLLAESKFMTPSLRFSGLDLIGIMQFAPGALASSFRDRANSNLIGLSSMSNRAAGFWSAPMASRYSSLILRMATFSSPEGRLAENGVALPWSVESTSTRRGLFELGRLRGDERKGAVRRSVNLFFVVVAGVCERGDSGQAVVVFVSLYWRGLKARARASGEIGEAFGESDLRK
jgi:hypothetical protein